jgi:hypothetical protein
MSVEIVSRPMTAREQQVLAKFGRRPPGRPWAVRPGSRRLLVFVASVLLAAAILWRGPNWLLEVLRADTGPLFELLLAALALLALFAVWRSWRWHRAAVRNRERLFGAYWADLDAGTVDEERYRFEDGLSLLEPESGGQIYLLKLDAARCLVLYDRESCGLRERGGDPLGSAMQPARGAVLRRAPRSGLVLSVEFDGPAFDKTPSDGLGYAVPSWSRDSRIWEVPWDELQRRIAGA